MFITAINKNNSTLALLVKSLIEQNKKKETIPPTTNTTSNIDKTSIFAKLNELYQKAPVKPSQPPTPPKPQTKPATPPTTSTIPPAPLVKPTYNFSYLPFDPTQISVGDAYAKIARLDNNENLITFREQSAATELLNSGFYKETKLNTAPNIEFLRNINQPSSNEDNAYQELNDMSKMPMFADLFKELEASGEKIKIMVSNYGVNFAASNINLTDKTGQKVNVITIDPNYVDYDHNNPNKRNILSALSNELQEIAARIKENKQNTSYVATKPFQEATLSVDQLMEDFLYDFSAQNKIDFNKLSPEQKSNSLRLITNSRPETIIENLNKNLSWIKSNNGYGNLPEMNNSNTSLLALAELNKKLDYLLGTNRQITFAAQKDISGNFYFKAIKI